MPQFLRSSLKSNAFILLILIFCQVGVAAASLSSNNAPEPDVVATDAVATPPPTTSGGTKKSRPRIALALCGGGTRGVAHIGVLRIFEREHIPFDCVAGTSMGAILGGLYCSGIKPDDLERMVISSEFLHAFYTIPLPVRVALEPIFYIPRLLGVRSYEGLYRGGKFANFLDKKANQTRIESLPIPFCAVVTNLLDSKSYFIKEGDLGKALQASSAVPFLRRPVVAGDKLLVDGGILANLPVKQAKEALGADIVIAVNVDESSDYTLPDEAFKKPLSTTNRVLSMMLMKVDESQVAQADFVIQPDVNGIALLSTKKGDGARAVEAGEDAALEALPELKAKLRSLGVDID